MTKLSVAFVANKLNGYFNTKARVKGKALKYAVYVTRFSVKWLLSSITVLMSIYFLDDGLISMLKHVKTIIDQRKSQAGGRSSHEKGHLQENTV